MKKAATDEQFIRMTTAPVSGLILSLAVPSMVTTLITSVYNLADTFLSVRSGPVQLQLWVLYFP